MSGKKKKNNEFEQGQCYKRNETAWCVVGVINSPVFGPRAVVEEVNTRLGYFSVGYLHDEATLDGFHKINADEYVKMLVAVQDMREQRERSLIINPYEA